VKVFEPKIVVFCCNWYSTAGADIAGIFKLKIEPYSLMIRTMCSGRVEPTFVLHAFSSGADGVMVIGCHPGDCHYESGNYKARRRIMLLKNTLLQLGIEPERLRLELIPESEGSKLQSLMSGFIDKLTELGPVNIRLTF